MADKNRDEEGVIQEAPVVADRSSMPASPRSAYDIEKKPGKAKLRFLGAAALVILSLSGGVAGGLLATQNDDNTTPTLQKQQIVLKNQGELISSIADKVSPSVVSVEVTAQAQPLEGLFGLPGRQPVMQGAGTGIIIDKSGLIVTNRHVVPAGASKVSVTLADGTKLEEVDVAGRTAASDPLDIAFLKIKDAKGKQLVPARMGDSSKIKVGYSVVAIGNALGQFKNTVTSGIISGHGRSLAAGDETGGGTEQLQNLFQTDAAINQGNSGGPLVNLEGEVIGINTAVAGNAENIGFAIPINDAKGMIGTVITKGKLERPFLGVVYVPITADIAKYYQLGSEHGAYIPPAAATGQQSIIKDSPANKAGIKEGDIITKVNDEEINAETSLTSLLGKHQPNDKISITYIRDGKPHTAQVTLGIAPEG